jgi:UDP-glucose 4-epimerase
MRKRYLVTGGAGFVGSHLTDALLARGDRVTVLDDLSTGRRENLKHALATGACALVEGSVLDALLVARCVEAADVVVHLAAKVGMSLAVRQPMETLETNVRGTEAVLHALRRTPRLFVLASTSEVYGTRDDTTLREELPCQLGALGSGRTMYAISKLTSEAMTAVYVEKGGAAIVMRLFNVVGPRQSGEHGMVVPRFVDWALRGEPLLVYGDGTQRRCFCHVSDVVAAILALTAEPGSVGMTVNIGSPDEISMRALAERVLARTGSSSILQFVPHEKVFGRGFVETRRRRPDTTRLERLTGWRPSLTIDDVIDDVAAAPNDTTSPAVPSGLP